MAGTIGAALNGIGIGGVAPKVDIVNIRAGQDSGFFLLGPTLDALTYAGDNGIDVVNMSYFIDPWLYNCAANPADSPAEQLEQRTIIAATQRAMNYARVARRDAGRGRGQRAHRPRQPDDRRHEPGLPAPAAEDEDDRQRVVPDRADRGRRRDRRPSVARQPGQSPFPRKAYYSNYGVEQTDVAAPGGD